MHRPFDFCVAFVGLVLLSPLLAVIGVAIKLHDGGPIFYRARRVGMNGKLFTVYKFRTMVPEADKDGVGITPAEDQRITALGRLLRRFKLDELPQLFNVVRGEMSVVGPRPEDPRYVAAYSCDQRQVLTFRPGITSPASLYFRHEEILLTGKDWDQFYTRQVLPRKLDMDIDYFHHRSTLGDLRVVVRTIAGIVG